MNKFYGMIGYVQTVEKAPGVWVEESIEKPYYGELTRLSGNLDGNSTVVSNINLANEISIVADPFANENITSMRYVVFKGMKWKIKSVEVSYPRLILKTGGIYHENEN